MLKTSLSTDQITSAFQIGFKYDEVDDSGSCSGNFSREFAFEGFVQGFSKIAVPLTSMLKTSVLRDLSTSAILVIMKYDKVDRGKSGAGSKLVKKFVKK